MAGLDSNEIKAAARSKSGVSDLSFEPGCDKAISVAMASAEQQGISPLGKVFSRAVLVEALSNQLGVKQMHRDSPELSKVSIDRPVFVLGFPRSGTTLLHNCLARVQGCQALKYWQLSNPVPVHTDATVDERKRRKNASTLLGMAKMLMPEQAQMKHISVDTYEECWPLFTNTLKVLNFDLANGMFDYGDWLLEQEMTSAYQFYKQELQILGTVGGRLVLKCPEHMWFLDALLEVFPDASIVWLHRDPVRCVASYASMSSLTWRLLYGRVDPTRLGAHILRRFHQGVERAQMVRNRLGGDNFYDQSFLDLVADPVAAVEKIGAWCGLDISSEGLGAVTDYVRDQSATESPHHIYSADRFGLNASKVRERFSGYIDQYDIQREDVS